jgi:amino acid permease
MLLESEEKISSWQAVAGIINGMVGCLILGLPVLTLYSGYVSAFILIIVTGLFCAFSSWIYFQHLGEEPDIGHALKKHFKNNIFKILYDSLAFIFLIITCVEFFQLIVTQWEIILPKSTKGW